MKRVKYLCIYPGCTATTDRGNYCTTHRPAVKADTQRHYDQNRESRTKTYGDRWRKLRKWFIKHHPYCEICKRLPTEEVHHKQKVTDRPDLMYRTENLMGLCTPCHSRLTRQGK